MVPMRTHSSSVAAPAGPCSFRGVASAAFFGLLLVGLLAGCGSGGGDSGGSGGSSTSVLNPVSSTGQVTAPASIFPSTLTVQSGIDSQSINSDGSFKVQLNKGNTQLVMAVNTDKSPVLMSIAVNAQEGMRVPLDVQSTAKALIYLAPGVAQENQADAQTVMAYINSLPETGTLANLLAAKMATNPSILASETVDQDINTAISNALQALISEVQSSGGIAKGNSLLGNLLALLEISKAQAGVDPTSASGLTVSFDENTKQLQATNGMKRYVDFYEVSPNDKFLFSLKSVSPLSMLVDIVSGGSGATTAGPVSIVDFQPGSNVVVKAYGLGVKDISTIAPTLTGTDIGHLIPPVTTTFVIDIITPILGTTLGIGGFGILAKDEIALLLETVVVSDTSLLQLAIQSGDLKGISLQATKLTFKALTTNNNKILLQILGKVGLSGVLQSGIGMITGVGRAITTVSSAVNVIGGFYAIGTTRLVEQFTITASEQTSTLTVQKPGFGTGTVTSNPAGINCGATCTFSFTSGTTVVLTATPDTGSIFGGWSGGGCNGAGSCTLTMDQARTVTATFAPQAGIPIVYQPSNDIGVQDIWTTSVFSYTGAGGGPGGGLNNEQLRVGGFGDLYYSLVQFDLSQLPPVGSKVELQLYMPQVTGAGTTGLYVDRITAFWDWRTQGTGQDRLRLWWADRPSAIQWIPSSLPAPTAGQWYVIDITTLYNAWQAGTYPNYGVQLRPVTNSNTWADFSSSNSVDALHRPRLVVTPITVPGGGGGTLTVTNAPAGVGGTFVAGPQFTQTGSFRFGEVLWSEAPSQIETVGVSFNLTTGEIQAAKFTSDSRTGTSWRCSVSSIFACNGVTVNVTAGTATFSNTVLTDFVNPSSPAPITLNGTLNFTPF